jgi:hypothetical protein
MNESDHQSILDAEHLRLLRIAYFIQGGTTLFMCLFGLLYVFMGIFAFSSSATMPASRVGPSPQFIGYIFAWLGGLFTLGGAALATLKFLTARALGLRRARMLCMITAALSCIFVPYGTAIGVCTFVVLGRPSVRALFSNSPAEGGTAGFPQPPPASPVA